MKYLIIVLLLTGCTPEAQQALANIAAQDNAYRQQQHMNAVWAANPDYAACRYNGSCNAYNNAPTRTICQKFGARIECSTY